VLNALKPEVVEQILANRRERAAGS
jgi:hypothetical protein